MQIYTEDGKLSKASQLYNLICMRERKEGQIRSLRWGMEILDNQHDREPDEPRRRMLAWALSAFNKQLQREHNELGTIKEDIEDLKQELHVVTENIEHLAMIFVK